MRRLRALALLPFFLSACGPQKEREPNDDYSQATPIRPGKVRGTISQPREADLYRLEVRQNAVLSVFAGGIREMDFTLSVRDKDRRELKRCDETGVGGDEEVLDIGVRPGTYYVALANKNAKANNPAQAYAMEVRLEKPGGRELEPDESAQTASPLELPGTTRGHYWPSRNLLSGDTDYAEADWYRVDVATGLFLLNLDLAGVPQTDPVLEVYDANAYKLVEVDSGGAGEGESLRNFGVRGPVRYFLKLRSKDRNAGNPDVPYDILSELVAYQGRSEFEPNDQRQDATPFEGDSMAGTIAPQGDADWYKVGAPEGPKQIVRASLTGIDGMDLALKVCDSLGNPLLAIDDAGKGQPEALTGIGAFPGDYYLVVSEKTGRRADSRDGYALAKTWTAFQTGLEYEVNDSTASAQPVKVGESVDGYMAPKGDLDFYQFNVYRQGTVLFELAGVLNVQFTATLYDQDYKELGGWRAAKAGEALSFEKELEAGTYFLALKAAGPEQVNVRDKYSLRLRVR